MRKVVLICCLCIVFVAFGSSIGFCTIYEIHNLGALGLDPQELWNGSWAESINNTRQVVGRAGTTRGFIWDNVNGMKPIPELSDATNINDNGHILGMSTEGGPWLTGYGYCGAGGYTLAFGLNNNDQVVGRDAGKAYRWYKPAGPGNPSPIVEDLGSFWTPRAINDAGEIVGQTYDTGKAYKFGYGVLDDFGYGGSSVDINNSGQVVGFTQIGPGLGPRAVIWDTAHTLHNLGTLVSNGYSKAMAINNLGQVVGQQGTEVRSRGFVWDEVGGMQELGTLGGTWSVAFDINDNGWIVGQAATPDEVMHAVLWIPIPTVTIDQAAGQADPTNTSPINFTAVFSEPVSDFTTEDVSITGTACATIATVTGSGKTYNVAVSGMTSEGTVIADIAAGVAHDAAGTANIESTSTDNAVTFLIRRIISANVTLKNWTAASTVTLPIQVKYRKSGTSDAPMVVALNLPVTPGGGVGTTSFALPDLTPGTYDIWIKSGHWLAGKLSNIDVTAGDSTGNMLVLKNGDINGDNTVNFSDYLLLQASYKQSPVPIPSADLNGDGAVNFLDYLILQANYKKVGDAL